MIPFTDLYSQYLESRADIDAAIAKTIATNSFITGPDVIGFENTIRDYLGAPAVASTGSGTTALQVALKACGIGPGMEVITTSHTFVSTVEAIVNVGAIPVMIDIDRYYQLDVDLIEEHINERTAAILSMDAYGQSPDIKRIRDIADKHGLKLISDSAHSFGSEMENTHMSQIADIACYSFNPVKNFGAMGDAGCVAGRVDLVERARMFRDHGRNTKFVFEDVGYNARIDNMQANILLAKLPHLKQWNARRQIIAHRYNKELKGIVKTPEESGYSSHVYYVYVIECDDRDGLAAYLKSKDIMTNIHYPIPCHLQPAFASYHRPLAKVEAACNRILSLPCYHSLAGHAQTHIIRSIKEWKATR
jgi:dTDP-4-amino-4,6-dideoxygalactose transaminase